MVYILIIFLMCLIFPEITHSGIKNGLILLMNQVIPALYPFIILTSMLKTKISNSTNALWIILAFLSGYPLGAKMVADHPSRHMPLTAQDLLLICNNPSPAFMMSFVGHSCLGHPILGFVLYLIVLVSNVLTLFLKTISQKSIQKIYTKNIRLQSYENPKQSMEVIIQESFHSILNISTYILICSVLASFVKQLSFLPEFLNYVCVGLIEMTTGIQSISLLDIDLDQKLIIISGLVSFGGISIMAQTYGMIQENHELSIKKYMTDKAISSAIAMSVMYGITILFR